MKFKWEEAIEVQTKEINILYYNSLYVFARFADRISAYLLDTQQEIIRIMGDYKIMAIWVYSNTGGVIAIDQNGIDHSITFDMSPYTQRDIDVTETFLASYSQAMNYDSVINSVKSCGTSFIYNMTRSSGVTQDLLAFPMSSTGKFSVPGVSRIYHDVEFVPAARALVIKQALVKGYSWPKKNKKMNTSVIRTLPNGCTVQFGSSFIALSNISTERVLVKFDPSTLALNQTVIAVDSYSKLGMSNDLCIVVYNATYKLFRYNSTSTKFEEDLDFNTAGDPFPVSPYNIFSISICEELNMAVASYAHEICTIDLTDGSLLAHDLSTGSSFLSTSHSYLDLGVGKDKFLGYTTYPATNFYTFNLVDFSIREHDISDDLAEYKPVYDLIFSGGDTNDNADYAQLPIKCMYIQAFSTGFVITPWAGSYYGSTVEAGKVRYEMDPVTHLFSFLDTNLDYGLYADTNYTAYNNAGRFKTRVNSTSQALIDYDTTPLYSSVGGPPVGTYRSNGDGPVANSTALVVLENPSDYDDKYVISTGPESSTFLLYDFENGDCLPISSIEHDCCLDDYLVLVILSEGERFLVWYSLAYNWFYSPQSLGGMSEQMASVGLSIGVEGDNSNCFKPYGARKIREVSHMEIANRLDLGSIIITFTSGGSLVLALGDLID